MRRMLQTALYLALLLVSSCLIGGTVAAEETQPPTESKSPNVYQVDFSVRELEDSKPVNTRNYSLLLQTIPDERVANGRVRAVSRVPIILVEGQVEYQEVGLSIDCGLREQRDRVLLEITFEISDLATPQEEKGLASRPVFRTIRSQVRTGVLAGKPTVVSKVDDTATKRRYELEVTATKVK